MTTVKAALVQVGHALAGRDAADVSFGELEDVERLAEVERILEDVVDDRMAGGPCLAGQPFVIGEQRVLADGLELRILVAAKTAAELQAGAGSVGHPQFNHANECLHLDAPVATPDNSIGDLAATGAIKLQAGAAQSSCGVSGVPSGSVPIGRIGAVELAQQRRLLLERGGHLCLFVPARQELTAGLMATGHAKATGRIGVCVATRSAGQASTGYGRIVRAADGSLERIVEATNS